MSLDFVSNAKLYANPYYTILSGSRTAKDDIDWRIVSDEMQANYWLEKQLGFYPHFVAVGEDEDAIRISGYDFQFRRVIGWKKDGNIIRPAGSQPNDVLFSWNHLDGVFADYSYWFCVLNAETDDHARPIVPDHTKRIIFKKSWSNSKWINSAKKHGVMLLAPFLDLGTADRICVRNKDTKKELENKGFKNVCVWRAKVER